MSKSSSLIAALICVLIWGTTFIAQDTGMEFIGPYVFNGVRFFVGFLALIPFFLLLERKKVKLENILKFNYKGSIIVKLESGNYYKVVKPIKHIYRRNRETVISHRRESLT